MTASVPQTEQERVLLSWIIYREGSAFTNDKDDRGGATKYGITQDTLGEWLGFDHPATPAEVQALTKDRAHTIYLELWVRDADLRLDLVQPLANAITIFDTTVLFGQHRGALWAQQAAMMATGKQLQLDGKLGPASRDAITAAQPVRFVREMQKLRCAVHVSVVRHDATQAKYLGGWIHRTLLLSEALELEMAGGQVA